MTEIVEPLPAFRHLAEAEIMAALESTDETNPIAREVARLIEGYSRNFAAHVAHLGRLPTDILRVRPRSPIEAVAMRLTVQTIQNEME